MLHRHAHIFHPNLEAFRQKLFKENSACATHGDFDMPPQSFRVCIGDALLGFPNMCASR